MEGEEDKPSRGPTSTTDLQGSVTTLGKGFGSWGLSTEKGLVNDRIPVLLVWAVYRHTHTSPPTFHPHVDGSLRSSTVRLAYETNLSDRPRLTRRPVTVRGSRPTYLW